MDPQLRPGHDFEEFVERSIAAGNAMKASDKDAIRALRSCMLPTQVQRRQASTRDLAVLKACGSTPITSAPPAITASAAAPINPTEVPP